jgi:heme exporter protein D
LQQAGNLLMTQFSQIEFAESEDGTGELACAPYCVLFSDVTLWKLAMITSSGVLEERFVLRSVKKQLDRENNGRKSVGTYSLHT